jgi:hypothetical protein
MAFESIFSRLQPRRVTLQYNDGDASRTLLKIDCTRIEELGLASQATAHAVEDGADICDHVIRLGRSLILEGTISDAPVTLTGAAVGAGAGFIGNAMGGSMGTLATAGTVVMANLALAGSAKPSKAALDIFDAIYENGTPLTIITGLATYTNMIMEKFSAPRSAASAGALQFKAAFVQVRMVTGQSVQVPADAKSEDVKDLSAAEQSQGRKQAESLEGTKGDQAASWAYKLIWGNN